MMFLMVVIRTPEEIKQCLLYTRQCALVELDSGGRQIEFCLPLERSLPDFWKLDADSSRTVTKHIPLSKQTNIPQPHRRLRDVVFLQDMVSSQHPTSSSPQLSLCDPSTDDQAAAKEEMCSKQITQSSDFSVPQHDCTERTGEWRVRVQPILECVMLVNAHVAACISICAASSARFRRRLFKRLRTQFCGSVDWEWAGCKECDMEVEVTYLLDVVAVWPQQRIDYTWGWLMNHVLTKRMLLEEAMAWLSTLGGAHSSLGEYFTHHAELAGKISIKQLSLAVQMGDPLTVARCHMFWAYSLLQRGHTCRAKNIVRCVYRLATTHCILDNRLVNMCLSAWSRLQHLHRLQRQRRRLAMGST